MAEIAHTPQPGSGGPPAVYRPGAAPMVPEDGIDLRRIAEGVYRRRRTLFISLVIAALASVAGALMLPRTYTARTSVLVQSPGSAEALGGSRSREMGPVTAQVDTLREFIQARNFMEPTLRSLGLIEENESPLAIEERIRAVQANIKARPTGANTFEVTYTGKDPAWPVRIVRGVVDGFIAVSTRSRTEQSEEAIAFLEDQMAEYRQRMAKTREAIEAFQAKNAALLAQIPETTSGRVARIEDELAEAQVSAVDAQMKMALIRKQLENTPRTIVAETSTVPNPRVLAFQARLSTAEAELAALLARYTEEHPEVRSKLREVEGLRAEFAEASKQPTAAGSQTTRINPAYERLKDELLAAENQLQTARAREAQLRSMLTPVRSLAKDVPAVRQQWEYLLAQARTQEALYNSLVERLESARMANQLEARQQEAVYRLIDPARIVPSSNGMRRLAIVLAGLGVGFLIGLMLMGLQEMTDRRVHSVQDLERVVGVPVLAAIPQLPEAPRAILVRQRRRRWLVGTAIATAVIAALFLLGTRTQVGREFVRDRMAPVPNTAPASMNPLPNSGESAPATPSRPDRPERGR